MSILSRLKLRTKFALLLGLSALGVVASIAISSSLMQQRMVDDRVDKLHAMVDAAIGIAQLLEGEMTAAAHSRSGTGAFAHRHPRHAF